MQVHVDCKKPIKYVQPTMLILTKRQQMRFSFLQIACSAARCGRTENLPPAHTCWIAAVPPPVAANSNPLQKSNRYVVQALKTSSVPPPVIEKRKYGSSVPLSGHFLIQIKHLLLASSICLSFWASLHKPSITFTWNMKRQYPLCVCTEA